MSLYFKPFWVTLSVTCSRKHIDKTWRSKINFEKWKNLLVTFPWTFISYSCLPPNRKIFHCHTLFSAKEVISVLKSPLCLYRGILSSGKLETWLSGLDCSNSAVKKASLNCPKKLGNQFSFMCLYIVLVCSMKYGSDHLLNNIILFLYIFLIFIF